MNLKGCSRIEPFELQGRYIRLEPLEHHHAEALLAAISADPSLYRLTPVPYNEAETRDYIATALAWRDAGTALAFAIVRLSDETVIGSTRYFELECWDWPQAHPRHGRKAPDVAQIGYTWLTRSAIRTAANTEAKLLLLEHAFESWSVLRVCFHTDARNQRSRAALQRIGGRFEGILRAHRMAPDFTARDSARFSILAEEWPAAKEQLLRRLNQK